MDNHLHYLTIPKSGSIKVGFLRLVIMHFVLYEKQTFRPSQKKIFHHCIENVDVILEEEEVEILTHVNINVGGLV